MVTPRVSFKTPCRPVLCQFVYKMPLARKNTSFTNKPPSNIRFENKLKLNSEMEIYVGVEKRFFKESF